MNNLSQHPESDIKLDIAKEIFRMIKEDWKKNA